MVSLEPDYKASKLTILATIHCLCEKTLMNYLKINSRDQLKELIRHSTHSYMIQNLKNTQFYLAKINRGRYYNNHI
uniref:Uncharacterized protein n=1 Tax=Membranoptera weeksiae TaxID=158720 RepID=A0A1N7T5L1_9FLOR|nr:hypothetical protein [Membranoptera weeksiae]AIC36831.1 hypothetical protein [Membranoptera weeksiae]